MPATLAALQTACQTRLWGEQGQLKKVHELLTVVYGGFTADIDTADLKTARALPDTLPARREEAAGKA